MAAVDNSGKRVLNENNKYSLVKIRNGHLIYEPLYNVDGEGSESKSRSAVQQHSTNSF